MTLDADRREFVVEQFMPVHVAVRRAVDMDASASANLSRVMTCINTAARSAVAS